jgi:hypothetical protein
MREVRGTFCRVEGINFLEVSSLCVKVKTLKRLETLGWDRVRGISIFWVNVELYYLEKQFSGFDSKQILFLLI